MSPERATAGAPELEEIRALLQQIQPLEGIEEARLVAQARAGAARAARERLVEANLATALDEASKRGGEGIEVGDLYQEGTLAVIAAVEQFVVGEAPAAQLRGFVRGLVAGHLDAAVEAAALEQVQQQAFARDAQLYETAEVGLRRRLGREPTSTEIASLLQWPPERVELMAEMVVAARGQYDTEILQYLEDE